MARSSLRNIISSRKTLLALVFLIPLLASATTRFDDVNVTNTLKAGAVGAANSKSVVDVQSTTKGVLLPRMTTTQQNAISSPPEGLTLYDNVIHQLAYYNGTAWIDLSAVAAPIRIADGSVTSPSYSFSNETSSGLYRIGTHDVALAVNGILALEIDQLSSTNVSMGFGCAAGGAQNPLSACGSNNAAQHFNYSNLSNGSASETDLDMGSGPSGGNLLSFRNLAFNSTSYIGGGGFIQASSNLSFLNIASENSTGYIAFNTGAAAAASNERMRITTSAVNLNLGTPLILNGSSSGAITVQPQGAAGTYNFNLPTTAGSLGNVLTSAGGGSSPMTWSSVSALAGAVPAGAIIDFAGSTCPTGYLGADGTTVSRTTFAILYAAIGNTWGNGDGSTTFTLPLLQGFFTRGAVSSLVIDPDQGSRTAQTTGTFTVGSGSTTNTSSTIVVATGELVPGMTITGTNIPANTVIRSITDSTHAVLGNLDNSTNVNATGTTGSLTFTFSKSAVGNYVGSIQTDQFRSHSHTASSTSSTTVASTGTSGGGFADTGGGTAQGVGAGSNTYAGQISTAPASGQPYAVTSTSTTVNANGGNETRPINAYVLKCVRTGL